MRNSQRCLQCGSQLAFLKKIASGAFCSDQHRDQYHAQLDFIIFDRLKEEKRRLVRKGAIAPAPLAQLLRRGASSLPPIGTRSPRGVEPLLPVSICVPEHKSALGERLGEAPYFHGIRAKNDPALRKIEAEPRGMRRRWPKSPGLPRTISGLSTLCRVLPTITRPIALTGQRPAIAPQAFARPVAMSWSTGLDWSGLRGIQPAIATIDGTRLHAAPLRILVAAPAAFPRAFAIARHATFACDGLRAERGFIDRVHPKAPVGEPDTVRAVDVPRQFAMVAVERRTGTQKLHLNGLQRLEPATAGPADSTIKFVAADFPRVVLNPGPLTPAPRLTTAGRAQIEVSAPSSVSARPLPAGEVEQFAAHTVHPATRARTVELEIAYEGGLVRSQRILAPHAPVGFENVLATGTPAQFDRKTFVGLFSTIRHRSMPAAAAVETKAVQPAAGRTHATSTLVVLTDAKPNFPEIQVAEPTAAPRYTNSLAASQAPHKANRRIEILVDPIAVAFDRGILLGNAISLTGSAPLRLLPLRCTAVVPGAPTRRPHVGMVAMRLRPMMPQLRTEPTPLGYKRIHEQSVAVPSTPWWRMPIWKRVSVAAPIAAILIGFYSSMDRSNVSQARADTSVIGTMVGDMRRDLAGRAAVNLDEAFDSGLTRWAGAEGWQESWKTSPGEAVPSALALLSASVPLRNYTAEFTAQPTKKAVSFVVRARDLDNYYAVRFVITRPDLLPEVAIERYGVVAGEELPHVTTPIHLPLAHDTIYHIRVAVRDSDFAVYLNNTIVDSWSDDRFPSGGIGFFSKKGEKARIAGLHVLHQDDTVGRLLAHISKDDGTKSR